MSLVRSLRGSSVSTPVIRHLNGRGGCLVFRRTGLALFNIVRGAVCRYHPKVKAKPTLHAGGDRNHVSWVTRSKPPFLLPS